MLLHQLKDALNGVKMIKHSSKHRHGHGDTLLMLIAMFITKRFHSLQSEIFLHSSSSYDNVTSSFYLSDKTEIIINLVIILFVCHLDELLYGILKHFPNLVKRIFEEETDV